MPYHTWLADVLKSAGLAIKEEPGWKTRGHGPMGDVKGIVCHHTAECRDTNEEPTHAIVTGRPGLEGPLCNLGLGQNGVYLIVAAGLAYHAGPGAYKGVTAGNQHMLGIEAENDGVGEKWPDIQMEAYAKGCAALAKHCGFSVDMVIGHKEWAPKRKIDPTFDMAQFRERVKGFM
jgi:hypothetical protein